MSIPIKPRSWKKAKELMEETYQDLLLKIQDYHKMTNNISKYNNTKWLTLFDVDELIIQHKEILKLLNKIRQDVTDYNGLFVEYHEKKKEDKQ